LLSDIPFFSNSSSFLKYLNFSFNSSSFERGFFSSVFSASIGIFVNLPKPSHVLFSLILEVDDPKYSLL